MLQKLEPEDGSNATSRMQAAVKTQRRRRRRRRGIVRRHHIMSMESFTELQLVGGGTAQRRV